MSEDRVTLEIPHFDKGVQLKDLIMKISNNILKRRVKFVETYLLEFCGVNGVPESELKNYLAVVSCEPDNSILVVNSDDLRDIKFGIKLGVTKDESSFEVFGEFLEHKDKFPKTVKLIEENGGSTGNTTITSGE